VTTPPAFEPACIHVVYEHALIQKAIGNVDLASVFIEVKRTNAWKKNHCLLIILLYL
jgi:hypothetical protein